MDERRGCLTLHCRARSATAEARDGRKIDQYSEAVTRVTLFKESNTAALLPWCTPDKDKLRRRAIMLISPS
jgi:hypothetical protein